MQNLINKTVFFASKINKTHLQFVLMLVALTMLVLGAGAPEDVGGVLPQDGEDDETEERESAPGDGLRDPIARKHRELRARPVFRGPPPFHPHYDSRASFLRQGLEVNGK